MNIYPFIEAERAQQRHVKRPCELLEVSRTAYHDWHDRSPRHVSSPSRRCSRRSRLSSPRANAATDRHACIASSEPDGSYAGRKRVARLMRENGLVARKPRRFKKTTIPDPRVTEAVDLLKRNFGAGTMEINTAWRGDITYIRTWKGWLYLATVIDIASRRVVGWAMADHMRTEVVADALVMAVDHRRPEAGLIFHSDRGCQTRRRTSVICSTQQRLAIVVAAASVLGQRGC